MTLNSVGQHKLKSGGERHLYNPQTIHMLQESTRRGDYDMFKQYTDMVNAEENILIYVDSWNSIIRRKAFRLKK